MFQTVDPALLEKLFIRPAILTSVVKEECERQLGSPPVAVPIDVAEGAVPLRCFWNVAQQVAREQGEVIFGWAIFEWPYLFWEAQHHAVWRRKDGSLIDVTPPVVAGATKTLFVEDPASSFDLEPGFGAPEDTKRFPSVNWPELRSYSDLRPMIAQRQNMLTPEQRSTDQRLLKFKRAERSYKKAMLLRLASELGSEAKCFCGSGDDFSACCRPRFALGANSIDAELGFQTN